MYRIEYTSTVDGNAFELAAALRKLPRQPMDIVILRYYDGKPLTETAKMMGLSCGAVKLRRQNALTQLRSCMK